MIAVIGFFDACQKVGMEEDLADNSMFHTQTREYRTIEQGIQNEEVIETSNDELIFPAFCISCSLLPCSIFFPPLHCFE
jgi:hypothetical protein